MSKANQNKTNERNSFDVIVVLPTCGGCFLCHLNSFTFNLSAFNWIKYVNFILIVMCKDVFS